MGFSFTICTELATAPQNNITKKGFIRFAYTIKSCNPTKAIYTGRSRQPRTFSVLRKKEQWFKQYNLGLKAWRITGVCPHDK